MTLKETLEDNAPLQRIRAKCKSCGNLLYDTSRSSGPVNYSPLIISKTVETIIRSNQRGPCDDAVEVIIDAKRSSPVEEIDATITVND